ncbi:S4 domain-containing protein, partial [Acinetobacter baumannii]
MRFRMEGVRLDQAVAEACGVSRSRAQEWIAQGRVQVGEKVVEKASYRLKGEEVLVVPPEEKPFVAPQDLAIPVLYEDEDLLVLNKPAG